MVFRLDSTAEGQWLADHDHPAAVGAVAAELGFELAVQIAALPGAREHDGVGAVRDEGADGLPLDVEVAVGAGQQHLLAGGAGRGLHSRAIEEKYGSAISCTIRPSSPVEARASACAWAFGTYPSSRAAARTRSATPTPGTRFEPLSTRDAVAWDTPARVATSSRVTAAMSAPPALSPSSGG